MASFDDLLPEYSEADTLERAIFTLMEYYRQSNGKTAAALNARLATVFPNNRGPRTCLAPWDEEQKAKETLEIHAMRRRYWTDVLRPLVSDVDFIASLTKTTVRVKEMRITTKFRDEAIKTLCDCVSYWDAHFVC